jgi:hypothetical protein
MTAGYLPSFIVLQIGDGLREHAFYLAAMLRDLVSATTNEAMPTGPDAGVKRIALLEMLVQPLLERSVGVMGDLLKQSRQLVVLCCNVSEAECRKEEEAVWAPKDLSAQESQEKYNKDCEEDIRVLVEGLPLELREEVLGMVFPGSDAE